jgi:hypothetical protein
MKCVCMQYIEALARLRAAGRKLQRTVHLSFMPDEARARVCLLARDMLSAHVTHRKSAAVTEWATL